MLTKPIQGWKVKIAKTLIRSLAAVFLSPKDTQGRFLISELGEILHLKVHVHAIPCIS